MKVFYQLALLFERREIRLFKCFPLHISCPPAMFKLILKSSAETFWPKWVNGSNKLDIWRSVVNLDSKGFKAQNHGQHRFHGTIQIDGIGVSIFKSCGIQLQETSLEEHRLPSQMFRILHCKMRAVKPYWVSA
jgi:hypothetical protein